MDARLSGPPSSPEDQQTPRLGVNRLRRTSDATHAVFADPASRAFEERLALLAATEVTVLITGETGTGKEVAARELHARSGRTGPFLALNCAALSESLAEAELFGYEKGAFTGALRTQLGYFEAATGGTLLLDEVGELPLALQAKLLRVLQEREVTRVGSRTPRRIDARIVAATNVDLPAAAAAGRFRRDLLFRLDVASINLRPLRDRPQDIEPLALHFLALYGARFGRPEQSFSAEALGALLSYAWPGNVRELDNVVHRAALLTPGPVLNAADLSIEPTSRAREEVRADPGEPSFEAGLRHLATRWIGDREPDLLRRATKVLVQAGFDASGDNQVRAAELLGVSRNTLRTHLSHLGVISQRRRTSGSPARDWVRVRIGIQKFGTSALLRLDGELERRLAAQRILIDWRDYSTGPPMLESLHVSDIDIGSSGEVPPIFAQADGAPLVYLAYEEAAPRSIALVVREDSPIRSMLDLRGHSIALSPRANVHLLLLRALAMHGLTMADIRPVFLPSGVPSRPAERPNVDAWMMWDPYLAEAQQQGGFRLLFDGTGLVANHRFYMARRHFALQMPEIVHAILDEAGRVATEAVRAPAAAASRLAEPFGMMSGGIELAMRRLAAGPMALDQKVMNEQQRIADHLHGLGLLPRAICVEDAAWLESGQFLAMRDGPRP